jgi:hypothetical protein
MGHATPDVWNPLCFPHLRAIIAFIARNLISWGAIVTGAAHISCAGQAWHQLLHAFPLVSKNGRRRRAVDFGPRTDRRRMRRPDQLHICDHENHRIQIFTAIGECVANWTGFRMPSDLAFRAGGNLMETGAVRPRRPPSG